MRFPVKSIGVIGGGVVGHATAESYRGRCEVRVYDVLPDRATHHHDAAVQSDLVFVCLPTPQTEGGLACDTSVVEGFFDAAYRKEQHRTANYVLRSTVPIGFTRYVTGQYRLPNLVHSPEFLTARTAVEDAANPRVNVIGVPMSPEQKEAWEFDNECFHVLHAMYSSRFPLVPIASMSSTESEAVKLVQNGFSAVKIAFFNEVHALLRKKGCDYDVVREALLAQGWVNPMHTQVPGPDGMTGFGGACLPKDLASLCSQLQEAACTSLVTSAALERNEYDRGKEVPRG